MVPLTDDVVERCSSSLLFSPRQYLSQFIDGLLLSRHTGIADQFLDTLILRLEAKKERELAVKRRRVLEREENHFEKTMTILKNFKRQP